MIHETTRDFRIRYNLSQSGLNRTRMDIIYIIYSDQFTIMNLQEEIAKSEEAYQENKENLEREYSCFLWHSLKIQ